LLKKPAVAAGFFVVDGAVYKGSKKASIRAGQPLFVALLGIGYWVETRNDRYSPGFFNVKNAISFRQNIREYRLSWAVFARKSSEV
jgi:hypothetical protein